MMYASLSHSHTLFLSTLSFSHTHTLSLIHTLSLQNEGQSLDEAVEDTVEMFTEGGYDLSRVWVYRTEASGEEKAAGI
jgi:hypothetical protein